MCSFPSVHFTSEKGLALQLVNDTGAVSVKGSVVKASTSVEEGFSLQTAEYDTIGIVYQNGVTNGNRCLVVITGIAEVLLADGTASTMGNWVLASATDGRADATQNIPPGGGVQEHDEHFKEIGHCLETKSSGTDVLAKVLLHFN